MIYPTSRHHNLRLTFLSKRIPFLSFSSSSTLLCILNSKPNLTKLLLLLICSTLCSPWLICPKFCLQIYSFTLSCTKGINIVIRIWLLQSLHSNILGKSAVVEGLCSTCSYDAICTFIKFKPRRGRGEREGTLRCQNDAAYWEGL